MTTIFANLRRQVGGLGDHPDAGFGSLAAAHDAADVVGVDRDGAACCRALIEVNETASRLTSTCSRHRAVRFIAVS